MGMKFDRARFVFTERVCSAESTVWRLCVYVGSLGKFLALALVNVLLISRIANYHAYRG